MDAKVTFEELPRDIVDSRLDERAALAHHPGMTYSRQGASRRLRDSIKSA